MIVLNAELQSYIWLLTDWVGGPDERLWWRRRLWSSLDDRQTAKGSSEGGSCVLMCLMMSLLKHLIRLVEDSHWCSRWTCLSRICVVRKLLVVDQNLLDRGVHCFKLTSSNEQILKPSLSTNESLFRPGVLQVTFHCSSSYADTKAACCSHYAACVDSASDC